jgi:CRISPR-associated endonuclease/helicase Cas3
MVFDLNFQSHPDKTLEEHICGVIEKSRKYSSLPIVEVASLFHDLGKINPNFQAKLKGDKVRGYSHHAYLSVLAFVYCFKANQSEILNLLRAKSKDDCVLKILQIVTIIAYHHGDIPNLDGMPNMDEIESAAYFLNKNTLPFSDFLIQKLNQNFKPFSVDFDEREFRRVAKYNSLVHEKIWTKNALENFSDTQFAFASLIQADKRDAGRNDYFQTEEKIAHSIFEIDCSLGQKFMTHESEPNPTKLNQLRTSIRIEATKNIEKYLNLNQRIFTLTAPTGAGKTFTLLSLARQIQKQKGNLGIIYALPFLSITEQVQNILKEDLNVDFLAINSKTQNRNIEEAQKAYEFNPTNENLQRLIQLDFAEQTFDHPFIVTTFVQLFETLLSNKNSVLLKLPNFRNRIFLIDEFQSIPPRLYIFFSALLDDFCKRNNSYAILSTATMPKLDFPIKDYLPVEMKPDLLFRDYHLPIELSEFDKYFSQPVFNRYQIDWIDNDNFLMSDLAEHIINQGQSCLVILNTIADTKSLYDELLAKLMDIRIILLNTHFIPEDRIKKIETAKNLLESGKQIILISTQLIEAGVDIDFPIVYRDLCPLPSLVQSAGRCNRNKKVDKGQVYFFQLQKMQGKPSSEIIYKKEAAEFLKFSKKKIQSGIEEKDLFKIQSEFFDFIRDNLTIGEFDYGFNQRSNMIECINKAQFEMLGNFQLINKDTFGEQYRYYIPKDDNDDAYDKLVEILSSLNNTETFEKRKQIKIRLNNELKSLENRILNVRITNNQTTPLYSNSDEKFGIRVLADLNKYSFDKGLELGTTNQML